MRLNVDQLPPAKPSQTVLWIVFSTVLFFFYVLATAQDDLTIGSALAFGFQLLCWAGALVVSARRSHAHGLRVSDPLLLVLLWCFLYLVLPSVFWLQGATIPRSYYITYDAWVALQWIHGFFIIGFLGGYLLTRPMAGFLANVEPAHLPSGWWLFLLPVIPLFMTVLIRVASGGGVLPDVSYSEAWYSAQAGIQSARSLGGIAYLLVQFSSKFYFFPTLIQSVGLGLIMSHWLLKGRSLTLALGFTGLVVLANLLLSTSTRSGAIIVVIIAVILVDLLVRPIPFSKVVVAIVVCLV